MMRNRRGSGVTRRHFLSTAAGTGGALVAGGIAAVGSSGHARAAESLAGTGSVVVYDGGGAYGAAKRAAYFEPFEKMTGIKVVGNPGAGSAKLRAGIKAGAPGYDVYAVSGAVFLGTYVKDDLLEPIDYRWFDPADKAALSPVPAHKYGVPALFYSVVLGYDARKLGASPPRGWTAFWDTTKYPGPRALASGSHGAAGGLFEIALLADGVPASQLYPLDIDRAFRSLDKIRPAILKFWVSGAEPVQLLVDAQVRLASAWNGRIADLQSKGVPIANTWDEAILQYDYWLVPKGAKNPENAMKFLAFVARPESQAKFAQLITYAPTNPRAYEFISHERASQLPTSPALRKSHIVQDYTWWSAEGSAGKSNQQLAVERWEQWVTAR